MKDLIENIIEEMLPKALSSKTLIYCQTCGQLFFQGTWEEMGAGPEPTWFKEAKKHCVGKKHNVLIRGLPLLPNREISLMDFMAQSTGKTLE